MSSKYETLEFDYDDLIGQDLKKALNENTDVKFSNIYCLCMRNWVGMRGSAEHRFRKNIEAYFEYESYKVQDVGSAFFSSIRLAGTLSGRENKVSMINCYVFSDEDFPEYDDSGFRLYDGQDIGNFLEHVRGKYTAVGRIWPWDGRPVFQFFY